MRIRNARQQDGAVTQYYQGPTEAEAFGRQNNAGGTRLSGQRERKTPFTGRRF